LGNIVVNYLSDSIDTTGLLTGFWSVVYCLFTYNSKERYMDSSQTDEASSKGDVEHPHISLGTAKPLPEFRAYEKAVTEMRNADAAYKNPWHRASETDKHSVYIRMKQLAEARTKARAALATRLEKDGVPGDQLPAVMLLIDSEVSAARSPEGRGSRHA
jgi:hypothetical protein